jgi:hypothetical protein
MSSGIERRLERLAEAISNSGCTCDGQGSVRVVRFVGLGDPLEEPGEPGEWRPRSNTPATHPVRAIRPASRCVRGIRSEEGVGLIKSRQFLQ